MARPPKEINWELVEKMIESGCTTKEICGRFHICPDRFYERFHKEYGERYVGFVGYHYEGGNAALRLTQYAKAINGNIEMLKLLGRERLNQGLEKAPPPPNDEKVTEIIDNMKLQNKLVELEKIIEELRGQQSKTE